MRKLLLIISALSVTLFMGCSNFSQPFSNIEQDVKTRPLAVLLDPCDAAPGDTVTVTAYVYTPEPSLTFAWTGLLDYGRNQSGAELNNSYQIPLTSVGIATTSLPDTHGLVTHSFKFIVPTNALKNSSLVVPVVDIHMLDARSRTLLGISPQALTLSNTELDSLLATHAIDFQNITPSIQPELEILINTYTTSLQLEAVVACEIGLTVIRTLTVRYSNHFNTRNTNVAPIINDISFITATDDLHSLSDLNTVPYDSTILYCRTNPIALPETVIIDTGKNYFLSWTHEDEQEFIYLSSDQKTIRSNIENYTYRWCYSNLDASAFVQDSLIVISGEQLLPPFDTHMHHFRLYLMAFDDRAEVRGTSGTGTAFATINGYFKYTEAYKEAHSMR